MADLTVDALSELSSPAANDEIGIWDVSAGQFMKIQRSTLIGAMITGGGTIATGGFTLTVPATGTVHLQASTFTPPSPNTGVYALDASANPWVAPTNGFVLDISTTNVFSGMILITESAQGSTGLFLNGGNVVVMLGQTNAAGFSATKNTANKVNVYWESPSVRIQNLTGASVSLFIIVMRTRNA